MPQARPKTIASERHHLRRLVDFADPHEDDRCLDVCLDAARGPSAVGRAIGPWVREVTSADVTSLPRGPFSLVTTRRTLPRVPDPVALLSEMLSVCRGRVVLADLVRTRATNGDRDRIERLRDPSHTTIPTLHELVDLLNRAGGRVRRLDMFTVERPIEPWLAQAADRASAERIRDDLTTELDGGPRTGTNPRMVGGELWFTQTWAHIAAEPHR